MSSNWRGYRVKRVYRVWFDAGYLVPVKIGEYETRDEALAHIPDLKDPNYSIEDTLIRV